jgi:hypothetical protein
MARPRKTRTPDKIEAVKASVNHEVLNDSHQALVQRSAELSTIDLRYAIEGDYDFNKINSMLSSVMGMSVAAALWVGRALSLVKANELPGTWLQFLQHHGLPARSAQRYMALAKRFGSSEQRKLMAARLGISNAFEFLGASNEDIEEVANNEDHAAYSMSRGDIRKLLDKKDKSAEKLDKKIGALEDAAKEARREIIDLRVQLGGRDADTLTEQAKPMIAAINRIAVDVGANLLELGEIVTKANLLFEKAGEPISPLLAESLNNARTSLTHWRDRIADALGE